MTQDEFAPRNRLALAPAGSGGGDDTPDEARLDEKVLHRLGTHLVAMYGEIMREPIPPHLLALLEQGAGPKVH